MLVSQIVDLILQLFVLPIRFVTRLFVSLHACLFWPITPRLTGNAVRFVSLSSGTSPFDRVRSAAIQYYESTGSWPKTYADLDPYAVLECTQLRSVTFRTTDSGALDVTIFIQHGKGRFEVDPPT